MQRHAWRSSVSAITNSRRIGATSSRSGSRDQRDHRCAAATPVRLGLLLAEALARTATITGCICFTKASPGGIGTFWSGGSWAVDELWPQLKMRIAV